MQRPRLANDRPRLSVAARFPREAADRNDVMGAARCPLDARARRAGARRSDCAWSATKRSIAGCERFFSRERLAVCFEVQTGKHLLGLSLTAFDPYETFRDACKQFAHSLQIYSASLLW
jgi:hypothetical protein